MGKNCYEKEKLIIEKSIISPNITQILIANCFF